MSAGRIKISAMPNAGDPNWNDLLHLVQNVSSQQLGGTVARQAMLELLFQVASVVRMMMVQKLKLGLEMLIILPLGMTVGSLVKNHV